MIARERADNLVVRVQNRVAAVAAAEHDLPHIVHKVCQMEGFKVRRAADAAGLCGMVEHARGLERVKRRCDDARCGRQREKLRRELSLADDQTANLHLNGPPGHIGLRAADDDGILTGKEQVFVLLRQGDGHLAAEPVDKVSGVVDDFAVQNAQKVKNR